MSFAARNDPFRISPSEQNSLANGQRPWKYRRREIANDEFDDAELTTPSSVRDTNKAFSSNGARRSSAGGDTVNGSAFGSRSSHHAYVEHPETPVRDTVHSTNATTSSDFGGGIRAAGPSADASGSGQKHAGSTPNHRLINDENRLTPGPIVSAVSPPRNSISQFDRDFGNVHDMEFDSSDYESPDKKKQPRKRAITSVEIYDSSERQGSAKPHNWTRNQEMGSVAESFSERARESPKLNREGKNQMDPILAPSTPRKSSPLRNEVRPNSRSSASDILDEIRNSGVLEPLTTEQIQDQIHSSMMRLEQSSVKDSDSDSGFSSVSGGESEDEDDDFEDLDRFLPPEFSESNTKGDELREIPVDVQERKIPKTTKDPKSPESKKHQKTPTTPESHKTHQNLSHLSRVDLSSLPQVSPASGTKRNRVHPTGKLSGKYARKVIRDNRQRAKKKYNNWSSEQWEKLRRLVDSTVPNSVIANSAIVMRELKCTNKQELAQRVNFLVQQGKKKRKNKN